jgi:diguanylate cyclase (GGDEF)-like protein
VGTTDFLSSELRERLQQCADLPSMPLVASRVLQLCREDDLDLKQVADTIGLDPSLCANVLRLVNSPAFGLRQEVRSTPHAIVLLGLNAVRTLALSCSLMRDLRQVRLAGFETYWKRALVAAVAARELALTLRFPAPDEAFLGALMQDIGILALSRIGGAPYEAATDDANNDHARLCELERGMFGADHGEVGAWLLGTWDLPGPLCLAVASSDGGGSQSSIEGAHEDVRRLSRIVSLSGAVADIWVQADAGAAVAAARKKARALLCLGPEIIEPLLVRTATSIPGVASLFDLSLGTPEEISSTLERATTTLVLATLRATRQVDWAHAAVDSVQAKVRVLEDASQRDPLTGLFNRTRLDGYLAEEFAEARRTGKPLSLIVADVDRFGRILEGFGAATGNEVLVAVGRALGGNLRSRDLVARSGGEEFVLVLPETDAAGAQVVAERIRRKIEGARADAGMDRTLAVTVSFGCATLVAERFGTSVALLAAAIAALKLAREAGGNRVESSRASDAALASPSVEASGNAS